MHIGFSVGKSEGKNHQEDLNVGKRIILKINLREIGCSGMHWIHLAQDRDQCRALVNFQVP
jgi:hypothetical protein